MRRVDGRVAEPRAMAALGPIVTPRLGRALQQRERRRELGPPGGGGGGVRRGGRVAPTEVAAAIAVEVVAVVVIVVELVAHRGEQRRVVPPFETKGGAARETRVRGLQSDSIRPFTVGYTNDRSRSDTRPRHSAPQE